MFAIHAAHSCARYLPVRATVTAMMTPHGIMNTPKPMLSTGERMGDAAQTASKNSGM